MINGLDRAVNYTRMYGSYISWRRPNLPMPRLIDPRAVFERMFGPRDEAGQPLSAPARPEPAVEAAVETGETAEPAPPPTPEVAAESAAEEPAPKKRRTRKKAEENPSKPEPKA